MPQVIVELQNNIKSLFVLDALKLARDAGNPITLNMVMLGAAAAIPEFPVGKESLLASMRGNLPAPAIKANLVAFENGYEAILDRLQGVKRIER